MSFRSLHHILGTLQEQSRWQEQPFQRLLKCWPDIVGTAVATHTRPLSISRGTLWVATSSAAWAQTLTFERQRILEKLNPKLPNPLVDIRFSTAQWQRQNSSPAIQTRGTLWSEHPSSFGDVPRVLKGQPIGNAPAALPRKLNSNKAHHANTPNAAFQHWAKVMQARTSSLPLCPQCRCPTPPGELQRWMVCSICVAKQW